MPQTDVVFYQEDRNYALTKEDKVPRADIERAIRRKRAFEADPAGHSYTEEEKEPWLRQKMH